MNTLHIFNQQPVNTTNITTYLSPGDGLLLIEDAVYAAVTEPFFQNYTCYALEPDIITRGLQQRVLPQIKLVDYAGFVDLTLTYSKVITWPTL